MNLNTLTSGLISDKYGIRPALMCSTRKDLARHSVVRILSEKVSGWIGISYGKVITGAKSQCGTVTLNGLEALVELLQQTDGHFDLIQIDSRLLGNDLSQSIGVSIDQLLEELKIEQAETLTDIVKRCQKDWESLELLESLGTVKRNAVPSEDNDEDDGLDLDDDEWDLDDEDDEGKENTRQKESIAPGRSLELAKAEEEEEEEAKPLEPVEASLGESENAFDDDDDDDIENWDPNFESSAKDSLVRSNLYSDSQKPSDDDELPPPLRKDEYELENQAFQPAAISQTEWPDAGAASSGAPAELISNAENVSEHNEIAFNVPSLMTDSIAQQIKRVEASFKDSSGPIYLSGPTLDSQKTDSKKMDPAAKQLPALIEQSSQLAPEILDSIAGTDKPSSSLRGSKVGSRSRVQSRQELSHLRDEMRQELNDFVQSKLNLSARVFQEVDLQEMGNYQSSLVLQDLENALTQARQLGIDLSISGAYQAIPEKKKRSRKEKLLPEIVKPEGIDPNAIATAFGAEAAASGLTGQFAAQIDAKPQRRKTGGPYTAADLAATATSTDSADQGASRDVFTEQVRKNTEVDPIAFLLTDSAKDTDIELKIIKQKQLRQAIVLGATTCLVAVSLTTLIGSMSRQANLTVAAEKISNGDLKGANQDYEKIIKAEPSNWRAYMGHANTMPLGSAERMSDYKKVLELKPDELTAAMAIAKSYFDLKEYSKAVEAAEKAIAIDRSSPEPLKLKGQAQLRLLRFEQAVETLKKAMPLDTRHADEISFMIANCYRDMRQQKNQLAYLNKAIEITPNNPVYLKDRAAIEVANGDYTAARADILKALSKNPSIGELHYLSGLVLLHEKKTDKALLEFGRAINLGYATADSFGQRGLLYLSKRMIGEAKNDLDEAVKSKPNDRTYQRALARADAAIEAVKARAGTRYLSDPAAEDSINVASLKGDLVQIGYDLIRKGKYNSATSVLTAAVRQNPNDPRARTMLAHAFYGGGNYVRSSTEFAQAGRLQPLSQEDQMLYGKGLLKAKRYEQAITVLSNLVQHRPDNTKARVELIKSYSMSGFTDHAREQCQEGMRLAKDSVEYNEFKSLMP